MDPISIITLAASTTAATYHISQYIYMFINSAKNVDEPIKDLSREVTGLRRILDAITTAFDGDVFKSEKAVAPENSPIWAAVAGSLNDCRITIEELGNKMTKLSNHSGSNNFFRQSLRLIKLRSWSDDIQAIRVSVNAHSNNLQISLQMVNILALGQSPDQAVEQLGEKVDRLAHFLAELQTREDAALDAQNKGQAKNPPPSLSNIQLKRTANELLSNPATVLSSGYLATATQQEQQASAALYENVITDFNKSLYDFSSVSDTTDTTAYEPETFTTDSDDETELEIAEISFKKGADRYDKGRFAEAESYFRDGLQHIPDIPSNTNSIDLEDIRLKLIVSCMQQEKWQESELMLAVMIKGESRSRISANSLYAHHLLALNFLCQYEFDPAVYHAQQAVNGRKHLHGKTHKFYFQSLRLLALIYEANGDVTSSNIYRQKVPAEYQNIRDYEPATSQFFGYSTAEYLRMSLKEKQAAINQLSESDIMGGPFKFGSNSLHVSSALIEAASKGLELVTRWLLARGADPQTTIRGVSALSAACGAGHETVARTLLSSGADVNISDRSERTPLIWASLWGHESTVRLLIRSGADVNKSDKDGATPLIDAALKGHASIVKLLLAHGADPEIADKTRKRTALLGAADNSQQKPIDVGRVLIEHGVNVNVKDIEGNTPLILVASLDNESFATALVAAGADVNARNNSGSAALHYLMYDQTRFLQLLLEHGAEPDPKRDNGETPLMLAAESNRDNVLRVLLKWGADPSNKVRDKNVMQIAKQRRNQECVDILQEFGAPEE